jgi:hypothetical protein
VCWFHGWRNYFTPPPHSTPIFETLYLIITFGHELPELAMKIDPPDDYYRIRWLHHHALLSSTMIPSCNLIWIMIGCVPLSMSPAPLLWRKSSMLSALQDGVHTPRHVWHVLWGGSSSLQARSLHHILSGAMSLSCHAEFSAHTMGWCHFLTFRQSSVLIPWDDATSSPSTCILNSHLAQS